MSAEDLIVQNLSVRFGGVNAVMDLTLRAPGAAITGLIGPNGAGKTTTFNACTGVVAPSSGTVHLGDRALTRLSTSRRGQAGLGRTFQLMRLVETANVRDNVALGAEALAAGRRPWGQLLGSAKARSQILDATERELERCGISHLADRPTAELSTGQGRLVELARALVAEYRFLLLDEPSSGLDPAETERFGEIVVEVVAERGTGVLLVEHDMALVRQLCSYIFVLDFGCLICDGPSDEVLASTAVRDAYLGTETVG